MDRTDSQIIFPLKEKKLIYRMQPFSTTDSKLRNQVYLYAQAFSFDPIFFRKLQSKLQGQKASISPLKVDGSNNYYRIRSKNLQTVTIIKMLMENNLNQNNCRVFTAHVRQKRMSTQRKSSRIKNKIAQNTKKEFQYEPLQKPLNILDTTNDILTNCNDVKGQQNINLLNMLKSQQLKIYQLEEDNIEKDYQNELEKIEKEYLKKMKKAQKVKQQKLKSLSEEYSQNMKNLHLPITKVEYQQDFEKKQEQVDSFDNLEQPYAEDYESVGYIPQSCDDFQSIEYNGDCDEN